MIKEIPFKKIAVIGAGTMGSGIAGQIANANQPVILLDIPGEQPNSIVENAISRLIKSDPPALMHKSKVGLIEIGNTRDDFDNNSDLKQTTPTQSAPKTGKTVSPQTQ